MSVNVAIRPEEQLNRPPVSSPWHRRPASRLLWLEACLLLAIAHVLLAGYQMGAGNQTIQIPFLKHWIDPSLYANDPAIATIRDYPSFFFHGLAFLVRQFGLAPTYFALHIATAWGVLIAAYGLAKAIFKDGFAGLVVVMLLFAGHHKALAGDELYSVGFTHTWAVFPLAIAVLILLYRRRLFAAFFLAGLLFNLHALTAAYLLAMMAFWAVLQNPRSVRWGVVKAMRILPRPLRLITPLPAAAPGSDCRRLGLSEIALLLAVFAAAASPTLVPMVQQRQVFDDQWIQLTRIRSADHSFPSSWWQAGSQDVPLFAMLAGLWALSLSFAADRPQQRTTLLLATATAMLFAGGYVLTDLLPVTLVIRAQLFRSSRLLEILMLAHIAHGIACGWRQLWMRPSQLTAAGAILEAIIATVTLLCLALPPCRPFMPLVLAGATLVALINGRCRGDKPHSPARRCWWRCWRGIKPA